MLADAGYADGLTITVIDVNLIGMHTLVEAIAGQLAEVGVTLEITTAPDVNGYIGGMLGKQFPTAAVAYGLFDIQTLYAGYVNPLGPVNPFQTVDAELDALYAEYYRDDGRHLRCRAADQCSTGGSGLGAPRGRRPARLLPGGRSDGHRGDGRQRSRTDPGRHPLGVTTGGDEGRVRSTTVPPMVRVTLRRLAWSIPLVLLASAATFVMVAFLPGDAAQSLAGRTATQPQIDQVRLNLGLDRPLIEQYVGWLKDSSLHGDLGSSMINRQPVTMILNGRLASSLSLIMGVTVLATIIGVAIGTFGARRGRIGRAIDGGSIIGLAVPDFWLGLMLIVVFAVNLGWFPPTGYVPWGDGIGDWLKSITLPVITLAVPAVALIAKQTRDAMSTALGGGYRPYPACRRCG